MAVARKMLSSFEDGEEVSPSTALRRSAMCDRITSFLSDEALCKSICSHCAKKLLAEQLATSSIVIISRAKSQHRDKWHIAMSASRLGR
jgi:hypothetical protein